MQTNNLGGCISSVFMWVISFSYYENTINSIKATNPFLECNWI